MSDPGGRILRSPPIRSAGCCDCHGGGDADTFDALTDARGDDGLPRGVRTAEERALPTALGTAADRGLDAHADVVACLDREADTDGHGQHDELLRVGGGEIERVPRVPPARG